MRTAGPGRAIDYDIMPATEASRMGLTGDALSGHASMAVIRCVDGRGEKLTAVCGTAHLRTLLDSGEASRPDGMTLPTVAFPVVLAGWLPVDDTKPAGADTTRRRR